MRTPPHYARDIGIAIIDGAWKVFSFCHSLNPHKNNSLTLNNVKWNTTGYYGVLNFVK